MKHSISLFTLMLAVTLAFGQETATFKLSNHLVNFKTHAYISLQSHSILKSTSDYSQQLDSIIENYYDSSTESWISDETLRYTYSDDKLTTLIHYDNDKYEGWPGNVFKEQFTYSGDNLTYYMEYYWNTTNNDWEDNAYYKEEYSYDNNGNTTVITKNKINSTWIPESKVIYEYDGDYIISSTEYEYDSETESWINNEYYAITYDSNGRYETFYIYEWEEDYEEWVASARLISDNITYDSNNNLIQYFAEYYDESTETWNIEEKANLTFDSNNNTTQILDYLKDDEGNWVNEDNDVNTFDLNYDISDILMQPINMYDEEIGSNYNNKILSIIDYDVDETNHEFYLSNKDEYYYSDITTTSINKLSESSFAIYPNPVINSFTVTFKGEIETARLELYNAEGYLVVSNIINNNEPVNISNLPAGLYFYTLNIAGEKISGKIIKK